MLCSCVGGDALTGPLVFGRRNPSAKAPGCLRKILSRAALFRRRGGFEMLVEKRDHRVFGLVLVRALEAVAGALHG